MKRWTFRLRFLALGVAALGALAACSNEDEDDGGAGGTGLPENVRPVGPRSAASCTKVWELVQAPGQFVGEKVVCQTQAEACAWAQGCLKSATAVSLGAWGGYVVVGFDHSVRNTGQYDLAVQGNSTPSSSEPGIVWVAQDANGDGLPNDAWYELKGSSFGTEETFDYKCTYYRPTADGQPVVWRDNLGRTGQVDYLPAHHSQASYFPPYVAGDSLTLGGSLLEMHNYDQSGNGTQWVLPHLGWGYADNYSPTDQVVRDGRNLNRLKISQAVDADGRPVSLEYIDFVRIQTGCQAKSGWIGECSTEVLGVFDYQLYEEALLPGSSRPLFAW